MRKKSSTRDVLWVAAAAAMAAIASVAGPITPPASAAPTRPVTPPQASAALGQTVPAWAKGAVVNHVPVSKGDKVIALTFDDGPNPPYTTRILKILKEHNARATFFMLGEELKVSPVVGREVRDAGHAIGNHSWSHPIRTRDPVGEVRRTDDEIRSLLKIDTTLFRPPYGILTNGLSKAAQARSEAVLLWSVDTNDWKRPGAKRIASRVIRGARPGTIVLMHDGGGDRGQTVSALPIILDTLARKGYRFVTVPELLQMRQEAVKTNAPKTAQAKTPKGGPVTAVPIAHTGR